MLLLADTLMVNRPSKSVVVPVDVPLTLTLTPGNVSPLVSEI